MLMPSLRLNAPDKLATNSLLKLTKTKTVSSLMLNISSLSTNIFVKPKLVKTYVIIEFAEYQKSPEKVV